MNFIDKPEDKKDIFEEYFTDKIIPLVEVENKIKDRYRSKFWGYLVTVLFLMSANVLFVLFGTIIYNKPVNWEQIFLVNAIAFIMVFWPVYRYNRIPKNDIFDVFLNFYGNWKHMKNTQVRLVHSPIIPRHQAVLALHSVTGNFSDVNVEMRDTFYTSRSVVRKLSWNKTVSSGVILYITFQHKFNGSLLMFDRGGFYRKNKFPGFERYNSEMDIPAANYFNIFVSSSQIGEELIHSLFLENILDLKEVFKARNIYLQAEDDYMRIYLEGSQLYFDNYKLWSKKIDKERFIRLHKEFEQTYQFVQTASSLMENK